MNIVDEEEKFRKRLENGCFSVDRKSSGEDYVESGKMDRDTEAVVEFADSEDFDVIRNLK